MLTFFTPDGTNRQSRVFRRYLCHSGALMNNMMSDLAESALKAAQQPAASLGNLASGALHQFQDAVNSHKSAGVEAIAGIARSARDAAGGFEQQSPEVARLVRLAAEHVERASSGLHDQNLADLAQSVARAAQARPKLFLGGSLIAGFLLSRLLLQDATPDTRKPPAGSL